MTFMDSETMTAPTNGCCHDTDNQDITKPGRDDILKLNVGGGLFEVYRSTLERYPDTFLGDISNLEKHYLQENGYYFLERHKLIFSSILYFYQSEGQFYRPMCVSHDQFAVELQFFGLTDYYEAYNAFIAKASRKENSTYDNPKTRVQRLWNFFKDPKSSQAARIWAIIDVIAISLAVLLFIVETMPSVRVELAKPDQILATVFFVTETACVVFFTLELVGRLICCPDKIAFLKTLMNWIDFITIIPYFTQLSETAKLGGTGHEAGAVATANTHGKNTEAIVVLRVLRVVRVLKLARHSKGILIVTKTLISSINELALLLFFWFIGVIIFGSVMYYIEYSFDNNSDFSSILQSSWWAVVTMSTVGYGDMYPKSGWGKLVASICMMFSMIIIALPVTVIVSKFTRVYAKYKDR